ncbi:DUF3035 domain-containing protein [Salibaculum griseiflavum]|uniref:DUF3035 domain-containing protein n=1 Tax=Salibaculum griseiflavum TaxID=1914409 RepID=A0A2V1P3G6_9RHOB|nr:DUF3035 domain-containing protein [Salibaculum griseiflavum]PWG16298.1 DUF3035 domain-containing protein [Salibaculum griseiflavum]
MARTIIAILALSAVAACGGDRGLHNLQAGGEGPDEFAVMPVAPLEMPETLATLPAPTPGGTNRTDPNPVGEAVVALGGNPGASVAGGIPANDSALVTYATRNGVDPNIRATLAAADERFRDRRARIGGLFSGRDRYFRAYANQALDAYAELLRFREAGVAVPSAPPVE